MNRPTLHNVAREAGVSHMTVSRVLHGTQVVKPETARRVREAVEKLGYRPDPALSALAAYRRKAGGTRHGSQLAFIDCDGTEYSRNVFAGVRAEASFLGYGCEVIRLPAATKQQTQLSRMLFHRGVQGLLFGPSEKRQEFTGWDWTRFAAVSLGALCHRPAMHAVSLNYFHGAVSGCERLRKAGCLRIALAIDPLLEGRTGGLWLGGYAAGVLGWHAPLIYPADNMNDAAHLRAWLARNKVDGVVTIHAAVAGVCHAAGMDAVFLNQDSQDLPFAHYHLPHADIGREGVRLLHHALLRHEFGLPDAPKHVALLGSWIMPGPPIPTTNSKTETT